MDRFVSMSIMRLGYRLVRLQSHYQLRPHGRLAWLQRLLWRALHRMAALENPEVEETHFTRVDIDRDRAFERIIQARAELFRSMREPPTRILVGPDEFAELMADERLRMFAFTEGAEFLGRGRTGRTAFNIPIQIVPHMRGLLVL